MEAPAEAPTSSDRAAHPKNCTDSFNTFLQAVALGGIAAGVRAVWDAAVAAPEWEGPPVWLHGDLHPADVVVSDGTLSGVIDFGDMFADDPAWDLATAWVLLPRARPHDSSTRTRMRTGRRSGAPEGWLL